MTNGWLRTTDDATVIVNSTGERGKTEMFLRDKGRRGDKGNPNLQYVVLVAESSQLVATLIRDGELLLVRCLQHVVELPS